MNNLDTTFAALSDPTRRAILGRLAAGQLTVGELAEPFDISLPAISRHLRVLEAASLIVRERRGQHRVCRLDAGALSAASEWLPPGGSRCRVTLIEPHVGGSYRVQMSMADGRNIEISGEYREVMRPTK